jgi:predicted RNA binding protein YcfA (HicA-like mRNA interferase family)
MAKLPRLTARQIIAVLEKAGFSLARQSGSHMIYKNAAANARLYRFTPPRFCIPRL